MKRLFILVLFAALAFTACRKMPATPAPPNNAIAGKWTIISVTVIPRDSTGNTINAGTVYPEPSYYYFKFNPDNTWVEVLAPDPQSDIGESGHYTLHSDTGFTLVNTNLPDQKVECKIVSLSDTAFVFTHQRATKFNGVTPGFLEYLFKLKKSN